MKLSSDIKAFVVPIPDWKTHGIGTAEPYLVAQLPCIGAQIWIYRDGADLETGGRHRIFEDWDASTPEGLRLKIVAHVTSLVARRTQTV